MITIEPFDDPVTGESSTKDSKPEKTYYTVNCGDKVEVVIKFKVTGKQLEHITEAKVALSKAGISFDTAGCRGGDGIIHYDWEFDLSLKGAEVFFRRISGKV